MWQKFLGAKRQFYTNSFGPAKVTARGAHSLSSGPIEKSSHNFLWGIPDLVRYLETITIDGAGTHLRESVEKIDRDK